MKRIAIIIVVLFVAWVTYRSIKVPDYWSTPGRHGDSLMRERHFKEAAEIYTDPWQIGVARYRNGDFENAAKTFARVPGSTGAFNQGNAWLMHGAYDTAIASYDRALGFRPGWKEAEDNKALALARKQRMEDSGKNRDKEQTDDTDPGEIKFDQKKQENQPEDPPQELAATDISDAELRATWLRRVATTPADFLRAKFAYQAAQPENPGSPADGKEAK